MEDDAFAFAQAYQLDAGQQAWLDKLNAAVPSWGFLKPRSLPARSYRPARLRNVSGPCPQQLVGLGFNLEDGSVVRLVVRADVLLWLMGDVLAGYGFRQVQSDSSSGSPSVEVSGQSANPAS